MNEWMNAYMDENMKFYFQGFQSYLLGYVFYLHHKQLLFTTAWNLTIFVDSPLKSIQVKFFSWIFGIRYSIRTESIALI